MIRDSNAKNEYNPITKICLPRGLLHAVLLKLESPSTFGEVNQRLFPVIGLYVLERKFSLFVSETIDSKLYSKVMV